MNIYEQGQSTNKQGKAPKTDTPFYKKRRLYRCNADIFPASRNTHIFQVYGQAEDGENCNFGYLVHFVVVILVSAQMDSFREYDIDGNKVKVECSTYCSKMEAYGDKDIVKILATAVGVRKITFAPENLKDNQGEIMVDTTVRGADKIKKLLWLMVRFQKVYNTAYPTILFTIQLTPTIKWWRIPPKAK